MVILRSFLCSSITALFIANMLLFRAAAVTFVGVLVSATPVPGSQSEMPATEFVPLRAPNLNYEWHKPTAQDLQVMASNGTYLSDAEGHPISGDTKRQFGPGSYRTNTFLSGDGDSHQNPFQQQVTQTFRCGADSCSVGQSAPHSLSWQTDGDRGLGWILGDFNVQEKYETDGTTSCDAGPGEEVWWVKSAAIQMSEAQLTV